MNRLRKYLRKERGQSMLEIALALPVLLLILSGLLDLGRLYYAYVAVTDAAAEGATYFAMNPNDSDEAFARAQEASGGLVELEEDMVAIECGDIALGAPVTVTVSYPFHLATPVINAIVPDGVLTLRAVANEAILTGELD